jgi:C1A family cysteine protease
MAVGYDDNLKIKNNACGEESKGAFVIRNSWGTSWGDQGYGYLPYAYVLQDLAVNWWTIIKAEWVDTGQFGE